MTEPIKPSEIVDAQIKEIPPAVVEVWNRMLIKKYRNGAVVIKQEDVISELVVALNISRENVFANGYLDVEEMYRKAGWKVMYDKPGYNESYDAYFEFIKP